MLVSSLSLLVEAAALGSLDAPVTALVILYIGPEIILPVASAIASLIGLLLMFWRYVVKTVRKVFRRLFSRKRDVVGAEKLVDFTTKPDLLERLAKRLGASAGEAMAAASGLNRLLLR